MDMASDAKKKATKPVKAAVKARKPVKSAPTKTVKAAAKTHKKAAAKPAPRPAKPAAPAPKAAAKAVVAARPGFGAKHPPVPKMPELVKMTKPANGPIVAKTVKGPAVKVEVPFSEGDYVVYPTHGVGLVRAIEKQSIAGIDLELFVITFDRDRMTLRVPVPKARQSGLRKLSSRSVMDTALSTLKGRARVKRTMWSRRAQEYEAKINSGDPVSIAEVVRDLHRHANQPDQSYSERQIYEAALERLAAELAAVDGIERDKATQKLETLLDAA
jgi:CarD family transcriptional regulator